jgi:endonuclease/exonuclease/phosphatase family metal-dependent hydrolase
MSQPRTLRVGTFNLFNLIRPRVKYYGNRTLSQPNYDKKIPWIGAMLRAMDSDIIGFQEAFHTDALRQALDTSGLYAQAHLIHQERTDPKDGSPLPGCALVSRFPVVRSAFVEQFPQRAVVKYGAQTVPISTFSRPVVYARLQVQDHLVHVLAVHLKSKRPLIEDGEDAKDPLVDALGKARSLIRRAAEALALRAMLLDLMQGTRAPVILLGDVNDAVTAVTNDILGGTEPWRFMKREQKEQLWDILLYNVKDIQSRRSYADVYYTHIHNGHYEALDHIFVSEEWVAENRDGRIGQVQNVRVFNDHLLDDVLAEDSVPPWQTDHGTVVAEIALDAAKTPPG